jgi:hypothetical protein
MVCGCENQRQIPVTVLPSSSSGVAQEKEQQHLQGGSLDADHQETLRISELMDEVPECRNYVLEVINNLNQSAYTNVAVGTTFYLRMEIYQDGSIGDVAVDGWTSPVRTPLFIQAIKGSHFPKWPGSMRSIVGHDYFIVWIDTGCPYSPGSE